MYLSYLLAKIKNSVYLEVDNIELGPFVCRPVHAPKTSVFLEHLEAQEIKSKRVKTLTWTSGTFMDLKFSRERTMHFLGSQLFLYIFRSGQQAKWEARLKVCYTFIVYMIHILTRLNWVSKWHYVLL